MRRGRTPCKAGHHQSLASVLTRSGDKRHCDTASHTPAAGNSAASFPDNAEPAASRALSCESRDTTMLRVVTQDLYGIMGPPGDRNLLEQSAGALLPTVAPPCSVHSGMHTIGLHKRQRSDAIPVRVQGRSMSALVAHVGTAALLTRTSAATEASAPGHTPSGAGPTACWLGTSTSTGRQRRSHTCYNAAHRECPRENNCRLADRRCRAASGARRSGLLGARPVARAIALCGCP
eukprot:357597-Chlamydomonas_euryale.AAC.5